MKRLLCLSLGLLLLTGTAYAQTSGKVCQAGQLKPTLEACLTLLQQLTGGADMVTIAKSLWLRLRQDSAQLSFVEAELSSLVTELQQTRDRLNSL